MVVSAGIVATVVALPVQVAQAADSIQTLATSYQPTLSERVDASGFKHPGIGFTKDTLENVRTQVRAQQEPWNTYFNNMLWSGAASKSPLSGGVGGERREAPTLLSTTWETTPTRTAGSSMRSNAGEGSSCCTSSSSTTSWRD